MKLHFLTPEEESAIKNSIPWRSVERGIRDLIALANTIPGIATLQSCEGHVFLRDGGFEVEETHIAFRATEERTMELLFNLIPKYQITDIEIRYFSDGTFWICIHTDPAERNKLFELFRSLHQSVA